MNNELVYPTGTAYDPNDTSQNHWKGGWLYRVGDVVTHRDEPRLRGVIVRQKTDREVHGGREGSDEPWYEIMWVEQPFNAHTEGQEHEGQLKLLHRYTPHR